MQKQEYERVKQRVAADTAAGKNPIESGAYASGLEEGTLRHIIREALKRKLLKEQDLDLSDEEQAQRNYIDLDYGEGAYDASQIAGAESVSYPNPLEDPFLTRREKYRDTPVPETGLYTDETEEEFQETLPGMSVIDPEDPEIAQIQQDFETGREPIPLVGKLHIAGPEEFIRLKDELDALEGERTKDIETGATLIDGVPLVNIDPDLAAFEVWRTERTIVSPIPGAAHGTRKGGGPRVSSIYGQRIHPKSKKKSFHAGMDIGGVGVGTPVLAPATGIVVAAVADQHPGKNEGAGNYIIVKSQDPANGKWLFHKFFHLDEKPNFKRDDIITQGQQIGETGSTGGITGPHLHWEVRRDSRNGQRIDPADLMTKAGRSSWEKHVYKPQKTASTAGGALQESITLRHAIQEALKRKLIPLKKV